jgi:hypothetical protein
MYCLLPVLLEEAGTIDPDPVAPEEGPEPDLPPPGGRPFVTGKLRRRQVQPSLDA